MATGSLRAACILVAFVSALSLYANSSHWLSDPDQLRWIPPFRAGFDINRNLHLGAEYYRIAVALTEGRGFSDPFAIGSGPTAWMPPLYPAFLASLLWLLGSKAWVAAVIVVLKNCTLVLTGLVIFDVAWRTGRRLGPAWSLAAYCVWLVTYFHWFFQLSHDIWLLQLLITASFYFAYRVAFTSWPDSPRARWRWAWGLLGGLNFLSSPIAGLAWLSASGFLVYRDRALVRAVSVSVLLAVLCVSGWVARNAVVFDRLVFMKSNLYFDLYLANYVSETGVYDEQIFKAYHPVWVAKRNPDFLYERVGEIQYTELFRTKFLDALGRDPGAYAQKVANRLLAATLLYSPYRAYVEGDRPLLKTLIHALPFLGLITVWLVGAEPMKAPVALGTLIYLCYLGPYVGVAFYNRYFLPLTPLLVLFWFWGLDALLASLKKSSVAAPVPSSVPPEMR